MDNSFLAFSKNNIKAALLGGNENWTNNCLLPCPIRQFPDETFVQITNNPDNIAFAGNILAQLVNSKDEVEFTFTLNDNFFISEFTDNGKNQIAYEFGKVGIDFGTKTLMLKLTHTVSAAVWYSHPFYVTFYESDLTKFIEYTAEGYFRGTAYNQAPLFQSVRLKMKKDDIETVRLVDAYTLESGQEISLRPIDTDYDIHLLEYIDAFIMKRLVYLTAHPIIYIDGFRSRNCPELAKNARLGSSSFFSATMKNNPTEEYRLSVYQLYQSLRVSSKTPEGDYSLAGYNTATANSTLFSLNFSKVFTIAADITATIYKNGVFFAAFDASKFSIVGQTLNIDVSANPITANDTYCVIIPPDKVYKQNESWQGYTFNQWQFRIKNADWINTDWNNQDFQTN